MNNHPACFDSQAATYDQRAGLPEQHCQAIAQAVLRLSAAIPGDLLLEVGAGTGMIGTWLAHPPLRYIGVDLSRCMLAPFQRRLAFPSHMPFLLQADGNHPWPLADGAIRVIFSSRALHLLDLAHVVDESFRVAQPDGASLIIGRIQRPPGSLPTLLQQALQRLLRQQGFSSHAGEQHQRQLLAAFTQRGGTVLDPVVVVRWTVTRTPWQSIEAWQSKPGLAGLDMPAVVQRAILEELRSWAESVFGDLHREVSCEEAYVLQGVGLGDHGARDEMGKIHGEQGEHWDGGVFERVLPDHQPRGQALHSGHFHRVGI
jgi:ubiquinone/menaquinone biosynthesis C-methylase UbiE